MAVETTNPYAATASTIALASSKFRMRIIPSTILFFFGAFRVFIDQSFLVDLYRHRASNLLFYPLQGLGSILGFLSGIAFLILSYRLMKYKPIGVLAFISFFLVTVGYLLFYFGTKGPTIAYSAVWKAIFGSWFS